MLLYSYWKVVNSDVQKAILSSLQARTTSFKEIVYYLKEAQKLEVEISLWHYYTDPMLRNKRLGSLTQDVPEMTVSALGFEAPEKFLNAVQCLSIKEHPPLLELLTQTISPNLYQEQTNFPLGLELWEKDEEIYLTLPITLSARGLLHNPNVVRLTACEFWRVFEVEECPLTLFAPVKTPSI